MTQAKTMTTRRHQPDQRPIICPHCGYDLRGTRLDDENGAYRCPECGERTTPQELSEMNLPLWMRSRRPPHIVTFLPAIIWTTAMVAFAVESQWGVFESLHDLLADAVPMSDGVTMMVFVLMLMVVACVPGALVLCAGLAARGAIRRPGSLARLGEEAQIFLELAFVNALAAGLGGTVFSFVVTAIASLVKDVT